MAGWDDEPLGAFGSASQVPDQTWFPVNTQTGAWQLPGVDQGSIGANISSVPAPGQADQAPLAIGQVAGTMAPQMTMPAAMQRVQRRDAAGGLTPKPGMWESIARGVAMASPMGKAYLQYGDQQQQQQLQNRLVARRQMLQEEQNERSEIRDDFATLVKLSEVKSKALRNLYTDRWVADMQAKGKALPADFIETFKKTGIDEGQQMARLMEPLITQSGMDPKLVVQLLEEGRDPKEILQLMEVAEKQKKTRLDEAESASIAQQRQQMFGTVGDASGVTATAAPTAPVAPTTSPASTTPRQPVAAPSKDIADAIDESTRLFPQVRKDLVTAMASIESNFDRTAESPNGAQGVMQLMPATQKDMGVTDPFDVQQNVRGGTRYYAQMLTKYKGNEALALAAYNWGPANVDKVGGDLSKMPAETQAYVKTTLQRAAAGGGAAPDTRMQVAGPGAPAPPGGTPQDQVQLTRLDKQIEGMTQYINANLGSGKERTKGFVNELQQERTRLIQEREKLLETPRALQRETAMQPLKIAQQEAGAKVQLEAKMNEPIGAENAIKMSLPAETKWKDVPKGTRVLDRPGEGVSKQLGEFKASHEGITRVIGMLDNPKAISIVGTLLSSDDNAAFRRAAGAWISSVTPAERKFAASLVAEIAGIRNTISGQAVTPQEAEFLKPMLPSVADPDVATVRAKLEVLQEWIARKHEGARGQLDEMGFRTPKALPKPAEPPPLDAKAQQALDILKPKGR